MTFPPKCEICRQGGYHTTPCGVEYEHPRRTLTQILEDESSLPSRINSLLGAASMAFILEGVLYTLINL